MINKTNPDISWAAYIYTGKAPKYYIRITNLDYPNPEDAPKDMWIVVIQPMQDGTMRDMVAGADVFFVDDEGLWAGSSARYLDGSTLAQRDRAGLISKAEKNGIWVNRDRYWKILNIARRDVDLPHYNINPVP